LTFTKVNDETLDVISKSCSGLLHLIPGKMFSCHNEGSETCGKQLHTTKRD